MKIDFRVQQRYEHQQNRWFPKELYTRYLLKENGLTLKDSIPADSITQKRKKPAVPTRKVPLVVQNHSVFTNISINPPLSPKSFDEVTIDYQTQALDTISWEELRPHGLNDREKQTYYNYDTLKPKVKRIINRFADFSINLAKGEIRMGAFSLLPRHLLRVNPYEQVALGIGAVTNERLSRTFAIGGYSMYGFGDNALKYGAHLRVNTSKRKDNNVTLRYAQDIIEPGTVPYLRPDGIDLTSSAARVRQLVASRADSIRLFAAEYSFRPVRFTQAVLFAQHEHRNPAYTYHWVRSDGLKQSHFTSVQVGLSLRFSLKETISKLGGFTFVTGTNYPVITARIARALETIPASNLSFTKADARLIHQFPATLAGKTTLQIHANRIWGNVPYPYLYNGNAFSFNRRSLTIYAPGLFQTMGVYEFTADAYSQLTIEHNFGPLFQAWRGRVQPELIMIQQTAYGTLSGANTGIHEGVNIKSLDKGYFESGIVLNNLLRQDARLYWLGYGAGVFYRYGPNANVSTSDNFAFVFSTTLKF